MSEPLGLRGSKTIVDNCLREAGRRFANELDFQLQLDAWFGKANLGRARRCEPVRSTVS